LDCAGLDCKGVGLLGAQVERLGRLVSKSWLGRAHETSGDSSFRVSVSESNVVLQEMVDQEGGANTRMEGNTESVDANLKNVSPSPSSSSFHGSIVKGALDDTNGLPKSKECRSGRRL
jgi:hypothetical protein